MKNKIFRKLLTKEIPDPFFNNYKTLLKVINEDLNK
jgi:hypothetical protein